jgi:hypothetical protein
MAPDSWSHYGVTNLEYFDVRPSYKYTTPHNIIRWTARTDTSKIDFVTGTPHPPCSQACHIVKDNEGNFLNKEYYLFESDFTEPWQNTSTNQYTVDGKLPAWWQVN